jgi:hypothetical protein
MAPILEGQTPPPLSALCAEHRIPDEAKASNMVVTVKRRFRTTLRRHVRQAVGSDAEVEEEICDLMQILSKSGAGS